MIHGFRIKHRTCICPKSSCTCSWCVHVRNIRVCVFMDLCRCSYISIYFWYIFIYIYIYIYIYIFSIVQHFRVCPRVLCVFEYFRKFCIVVTLFWNTFVIVLKQLWDSFCETGWGEFRDSVKTVWGQLCCHYNNLACLDSSEMNEFVSLGIWEHIWKYFKLCENIRKHNSFHFTGTLGP